MTTRHDGCFRSLRATDDVQIKSIDSEFTDTMVQQVVGLFHCLRNPLAHVARETCNAIADSSDSSVPAF